MPTAAKQKKAAVKKTGGKISRRDRLTREKIISYATKVFSDRGFSKVSVEEICRHLKIGKATFYKHFDNREDLAEIVTGRVWKDVEPAIWENLNSDRPIGEILNRHFSLQLDVLKSKLSTVLLADIQTHMPAVWDRYYVSFRKKETVAIIALLKRGQAEGIIRHDIDSEVLGKVCHAVIDFMASPSFLLSYGLTPADIANILKVAFQSLMIQYAHSGRG